MKSRERGKRAYGKRRQGEGEGGGWMAGGGRGRRQMEGGREREVVKSTDMIRPLGLQIASISSIMMT